MSGIGAFTQTPRKNLSAAAKLAMVQESYQPTVLVAEVARKYNVSVSSLVKWRKLAAEGSLMSVKNEEDLVPASQVKKMQSQIKSLERMLGKKTIQVELLKEAVSLAREKKLISRQPLPGVDDILNEL